MLTKSRIRRLGRAFLYALNFWVWAAPMKYIEQFYSPSPDDAGYGCLVLFTTVLSVIGSFLLGITNKYFRDDLQPFGVMVLIFLVLNLLFKILIPAVEYVINRYNNLPEGNESDTAAANNEEKGKNDTRDVIRLQDGAILEIVEDKEGPRKRKKGI